MEFCRFIEGSSDSSLKTCLKKGIILYIEITPIRSHFPSYMSTPSNKVEQYCDLSDTCVHDTIPICGRMGDEKRTFLDLCDMLEYACDTNQIFTHIDDENGCPKDIK